MIEETTQCKLVVGLYRYDHRSYFGAIKNKPLSFIYQCIVKIISVWGYSHGAIRFIKDDDVDLTLFAMIGKEVRFVDTVTLNDWFGPPDIEFDLGYYEVPAKEIISEVDRKKLRVMPFLWWYCIARYLPVLWKPTTCITCVCNILNICGYKIPIVVTPNELHKELI